MLACDLKTGMWQWRRQTDTRSFPDFLKLPTWIINQSACWWPLKQSRRKHALASLGGDQPFGHIFPRWVSLAGTGVKFSLRIAAAAFTGNKKPEESAGVCRFLHQVRAVPVLSSFIIDLLEPAIAEPLQHGKETYFEPWLTLLLPTMTAFHITHLADKPYPKDQDGCTQTAVSLSGWSIQQRRLSACIPSSLKAVTFWEEFVWNLCKKKWNRRGVVHYNLEIVTILQLFLPLLLT